MSMLREKAAGNRKRSLRTRIRPVIVAQTVGANVVPFRSAGKTEAVKGCIQLRPVQILRDGRLPAVDPIVLHPRWAFEVPIAA